MIKVVNKKYQAVIEDVYQSGQKHIFRFWDQLTEEQKKNFLDQISLIDFALVSRLAGQALEKPEAEQVLKLEAPEVISLEERRVKDDQAAEAGKQVLSEGKVAAFLVAGGQGTRLGFDGPKGMFPVTPVRKKSLFQLHAEKLLSVGRLHGIQIPWYIMTSLTNDRETKSFFNQNAYFGYLHDNIFIFTQEMIPAIDHKGKLILDSHDHIFMNPNGRGGSISALWKSGALADMKKRGISTIFYFQVDNVLTRICDPVYIGYHVMGKSEMSCKVVKREYPEEKMGVLCKVKDRLRLIEYSDLSREEMFATNADGSLKLWAGNIATHLFDRGFLERENDGGFKLPYHIAQKSIPYLDDEGTLIQPQNKNGIKFETFVFDALADAGSTVCLEVERSQEFSPLKNLEGENSPETVRRDLNHVYTSWLNTAGHKWPEDSSRNTVEISPLLSLQGENLVLEDMNVETTEAGIYIDRK
jgi:UDP-N-acetylglucosamine/UDP-N-acetylgalactosamine diphosphorylase